jgi:hypothetical protein
VEGIGGRGEERRGRRRGKHVGAAFTVLLAPEVAVSVCFLVAPNNCLGRSR